MALVSDSRSFGLSPPIEANRSVSVQTALMLGAIVEPRCRDEYRHLLSGQGR